MAQPHLSVSKMYFKPLSEGPLIFPGKKNIKPIRANDIGYLYVLTDREATLAKGLVYPDEVLTPGNLEG